MKYSEKSEKSSKMLKCGEMLEKMLENGEVPMVKESNGNRMKFIKILRRFFHTFRYNILFVF